jgi:major outer membrane protein
MKLFLRFGIKQDFWRKMKKIVATLLTFAWYQTLSALPLGNPLDPALLSNGWITGNHCCDSSFFKDNVGFRVGFYGDFVFNRYLEVDDKNQNGVIDHTRIFTRAGYLIANIYHWDLFATLGSSKFSSLTGAGTYFVVDTSEWPLEIETDTSFSWSIGARGILFELCGVTIGLEGQYFQCDPTVIHTNFHQFMGASPEAHSTYREWQIGLGIGKRFREFIPYMGVEWSHVRWGSLNDKLVVFEDLLGEFFLLNLKGQNPWAYSVGLTMVGSERVSITIEGRFAGDKALTINGQILF